MLPARLRPAASFRRARPDEVALHVRQPPRTAIINRPVLVPVSAHGSASDRNCALASTICLTMANRSKVERANWSMRVTVTTSPGVMAFQHLQQFAPVGSRARQLLAENLGAARRA